MIDEKAAGIYAAALEKYGGENQRIVALEELAELQHALCKDLRGNHNAAHIAEEIADVEIMLEQLKLLYGMEDLVESWREHKLARLQSRIAGEEEPGSRLIRQEEIMKAEREGRLVLLPCKVSNTIYLVESVFNGKKKTGEQVVSAQIDHVTIGGTTGIPVVDCCSETGNWYMSLNPEDFYLTRQEAEAALAGKEKP